MKKNAYTLNTILTVLTGLGLLIAVLVRTFGPHIILPKADIPGLVLISLAALLVEHYLVKEPKRCWICLGLLAAVTFGLLPYAACFVTPLEALKLGVLGGLVFTVVTWLFTTMTDRLSTGPAAKLAPIVSALGLYLASQALMGIF